MTPAASTRFSATRIHDGWIDRPDGHDRPCFQFTEHVPRRFPHGLNVPNLVQRSPDDGVGASVAETCGGRTTRRAGPSGIRAGVRFFPPRVGAIVPCNPGADDSTGLFPCSPRSIARKPALFFLCSSFAICRAAVRGGSAGRNPGLFTAFCAMRKRSKKRGKTRLTG